MPSHPLCGFALAEAARLKEVDRVTGKVRA